MINDEMLKGLIEISREALRIEWNRHLREGGNRFSAVGKMTLLFWRERHAFYRMLQSLRATRLALARARTARDVSEINLAVAMRTIKRLSGVQLDAIREAERAEREAAKVRSLLEFIRSANFCQCCGEVADDGACLNFECEFGVRNLKARGMWNLNDLRTEAWESFWGTLASDWKTEALPALGGDLAAAHLAKEANENAQSEAKGDTRSEAPTRESVITQQAEFVRTLSKRVLALEQSYPRAGQIHEIESRIAALESGLTSNIASIDVRIDLVREMAVLTNRLMERVVALEQQHAPDNAHRTSESHK